MPFSRTRVFRLPTRRSLRKDIVRNHRVSNRARDIFKNLQAVGTCGRQALIPERKEAQRHMKSHFLNQHGHVNSNILRKYLFVVRSARRNSKRLHLLYGEDKGQSRGPSYRTSGQAASSSSLLNILTSFRGHYHSNNFSKNRFSTILIGHRTLQNLNRPFTRPANSVVARLHPLLLVFQLKSRVP